jgi:hypothetical protein
MILILFLNAWFNISSAYYVDLRGARRSMAASLAPLINYYLNIYP